MIGNGLIGPRIAGMTTVEKLDEHGKEVARLQGIVERTYEPLADPTAAGSP